MTPVDVSDIKCLRPCQNVLGEGPLWDYRKGRLLWLDIKGGAVHVLELETDNHTIYKTNKVISALGLSLKHDFVCVHKGGFAYLDLLEDETLAVTSILDPEADKPTNRFNDGKIAPDGSFWAGTMDAAEQFVSGVWWALTPSADQCSMIDSDYHVTNGPAFDPEDKRVYLTDSAAQIVYVADWNAKRIENKRVFVEFKDGGGYPDGMTVDSEGALWIAFWDGACVRRFDRSGRMLQQVDFPVNRLTSLTFAGKRGYVTSARVGLSSEDLATWPLSGALFSFDVSRPLGKPEPIYGQNNLQRFE